MPEEDDKSHMNDTWEKAGFQAFTKLNIWFARALVLPATTLASINEKLRVKNPPQYYHREMPRPPSVDKCRVDDDVCQYEATLQAKMDMRVEREIVNILEKKLSQCRGDANSLIAGGGVAYPADVFCKKEAEDYRRARLNFEIKYSGIHLMKFTAFDVYMKQKHRLIWERRNGRRLQDTNISSIESNEKVPVS